MYNILVTCGRGFEAHVIRDIKNRIPNVRNISVINEGKVAFFVPDPDYDRKATTTAEETGYLSPNDIVNEKISKFSCLESIYELKTVERVMLLLCHHQMKDCLESLKELESKHFQLTCI